MIKKLKDLVTLKEYASPKEKETNLPPGTKYYKEDRKQTYNEVGAEDSTNNLGCSISLDICLQTIYAKFQNEEKGNKVRQEELNEPYRKEKSEKENLIRRISTIVLDNAMEKKGKCEKRIEDLKNEIADIPNNPKKYGIDVEKGSSAKFWIGLFLVIPIALYLFVFYISTSYSAFFKQFEPGANVFGSILDSNAFEKAWQFGPLAGMFVTFIPFVFLGLGFLIHMFGESKKITNYFKIAFLFIITFAFDAILAYQIEDKLYQLTKEIGSPEFSITIAFQEISFWGIIFAGFVVYIIFGLVFDFVMKEHKERDKIKMAIRERESKIKIEEEKSEGIEDKVLDSKETIEKHKGRIQELTIMIGSIIIPVKEYRSYASEYMKGWVTSINQGFVQQKAKILIEESEKVYKKHIKEVGADSDYQNKVFLAQA